MNSTTPFQISAGRERSVLLDATGAAYAWGAVKVVGATLPPGYPGELCTSSPTEIGHNRFAQPVAQLLNPQQPFANVADGFVDTLAASKSGQVLVCQPVIDPDKGVASRLESGIPDSVVQVAVSESASFALLANGALWSWGLNAQGQLGRQVSGLRTAPGQVPGLPPIAFVAAGNGHVLALSKTGDVWAWGANAAGQLGIGSLAVTGTPQRVVLPGKITRVAAGDTHSLVVDAQGRLWAWGSNNFGQIGPVKADVQAAFFTSPQRIRTGFAVAQIDAGMFYSVATSNAADVFAWGFNAMGQLGQDKQTLAFSNQPQRIAGLANITRIAAGAGHVLAAKAAGATQPAVWGWGDNRASACGAFPSVAVQLQPHPIVLA